MITDTSLLIYQDTNLEDHLQSLSRHEREICDLSEERYKTLMSSHMQEISDLSFLLTEVGKKLYMRIYTVKSEVSRHLKPLIT